VDEEEAEAATGEDGAELEVAVEQQRATVSSTTGPRKKTSST
jgi:hypothetical protein